MNQQFKVNVSGRYQNIDADDANYTLKGKTNSLADNITYIRKPFDESRDVLKLKTNIMYRALSDLTLQAWVTFRF